MYVTVSKYSDIKTSLGSQYETHHGYWKHTNRLKIISSQRYYEEFVFK